MKKILILCFVLVSVPINAKEINKKNWMEHPKIKEIRKIFQSINKHKLVEKDSKKCEFDGGNRYFKITIYIDNKNRVRKYISKNKLDKSTITSEHYYSVEGVNRFTFRKLKAVNGSQEEQRIYFNKKGKKIYEDTRLLKGPGYSFDAHNKYVPNPEKELLKFCK